MPREKGEVVLSEEGRGFWIIKHMDGIISVLFHGWNNFSTNFSTIGDRLDLV